MGLVLGLPERVEGEDMVYSIADEVLSKHLAQSLHQFMLGGGEDILRALKYETLEKIAHDLNISLPHPQVDHNKLCE